MARVAAVRGGASAWALLSLLALLLTSAPAYGEIPLRLTGDYASRGYVVIWLSGDGGWGKMERQVTRRLAAAGVPTAGISSLSYYRVPRSPAAAGRDVADLIARAEAHYGVTRFVFVGFSFGADAGPFVFSNLPPATRDHALLAAFLSPGARANFWAGPWSWLNIGLGPRVGPALNALMPTPVLCVGNAGVFADICPAQSSLGMHSVRLPGGHTLSGQYDEIAALILADAARAAPAHALAPSAPFA